MKFSLYLVALILAISPRLQSQAGTHRLANSYDYYSQQENFLQFSSIDEAKSIIDNIISVIGLKSKFEIKEAYIPNAAAVIYNSKRFILYNPAFISSLNKAVGNQWASVSILAHEIGHHLNGHTLEAGGSKPVLELEADEFSGFVLKKLGATLQEAQVAMEIAASQKASHTHPAKATRLGAIARGWNTANTQSNGNNNLASIYKKPTQSANRNETTRSSTNGAQTVLAEKYILKEVRFPSDPSSNYYITIRSNLVKVNGNNLSVLGKLISNKSEEYPLIIVNGSKNYWLITKRGSIITMEGKKIGYIAN